MGKTFNLYQVVKKTSFADAILMLNSIELQSRNFRRLSSRKAFIAGCLVACGFSFTENYASLFTYGSYISHDNTIYRLPYSCRSGRFGYRYCFDVDISSFK